MTSRLPEAVLSGECPCGGNAPAVSIPVIRISPSLLGPPQPCVPACSMPSPLPLISLHLHSTAGSRRWCACCGHQPVSLPRFHLPPYPAVPDSSVPTWTTHREHHPPSPSRRTACHLLPQRLAQREAPVSSCDTRQTQRAGITPRQGPNAAQHPSAPKLHAPPGRFLSIHVPELRADT